MSQATNETNLLVQIINELKDNHSNNEFNLSYQLLIDNADNYKLSSDKTTKNVITSLKNDIKPLNTTNYKSYWSIINYEGQKGSRALSLLKKILTELYHQINNSIVLPPFEIIKKLKLENMVLTSEINKFKKLRNVKVPKQISEDLTKALVKTTGKNNYDLDIYSSMKQQIAETDLIITRTYKFTIFASALLAKGLSLPYGSIIVAKGGDGATRFVRLLQGAGDLIKASKELWATNGIDLIVMNLHGQPLRMRRDDEAAQIITEGINQTLATLINQAKTKSNPQVITSVLGALLRAGYSLNESLDKMYLILDTDKTKTITEELAIRATILITPRIKQWHKMMLCEDYSELEIKSGIMTLVGVGTGNIENKRCVALKYHKQFIAECPECGSMDTATKQLTE